MVMALIREKLIMQQEMNLLLYLLAILTVMVMEKNQKKCHKSDIPSAIKNDRSLKDQPE